MLHHHDGGAAGEPQSTGGRNLAGGSRAGRCDHHPVPGDAAGQAALTTGLAVAGAVVAVWLLVRPSSAAIAASILLGVAWLVAYTALAVVQSGSLGALVTDAFLAAAGAAAAGLSWTGRPRHRR